MKLLLSLADVCIPNHLLQFFVKNLNGVSCPGKAGGQIKPVVPEEVANTLPYLVTLLSIQVRGGLDHRVRFLDAETLKSQIFRAFYLLVTTLMKKKAPGSGI